MILYAWAGFCLRSQPHKEKIHTGPYRHSQPQFISVPSASKANQIRPVTEWQTRNPKADCNIGGWILIRVGHSTRWERPMQRECFGSYFPKSCEYVWMTFVLQHSSISFWPRPRLRPKLDLDCSARKAQHSLVESKHKIPLSSDASPHRSSMPGVHSHQVLWRFMHVDLRFWFATWTVRLCLNSEPRQQIVVAKVDSLVV